MWTHLPVDNLINRQRLEALREIDRQIREDWRAGYGLDVDRLLERRHRLVEQMREGRAA
jgi:hypothetical protein